MYDNRLKNKIYANTLIILAIVAIVYFFIYPQYSGNGFIYNPNKSISTLLEEKDGYKQALNLAKDYELKVNKTNNDYTNSLNTLPIEKLNRVLPTSADPVLVVYELSKIAANPASGMLLRSPTFTDDGNSSQNTKKYNTLSVSFSVEGTYDNLKAFLKNLEKSERVYNVTNISFSSSSDTKSTTYLKYSITVDTYYIKQN